MSLVRTALVAASAVSLAAPASAQQLGGPDSGDYIYYVATPDFVTLAGGVGTALGLGNDASVAATLSTPFTWYGNPYSDLMIGDNGAFFFGTAGNPSASNGCLPAGATSGDVLAYWDDLDPSVGGDVYTFDDTANNRFIVSWEDVPHFIGGGTASFQVHLNDNDTLEFHYSDTTFATATYDDGATATAGFQDLAGGTFGSGGVLEFSCNAPAITAGTSFGVGVCADTDLDGFSAASCGGEDCDDTEILINPNAVETCDGVDENCDGIDAAFEDLAVVSNATGTGGARYRGNKYLVDEPTTLGGIEYELDIPVGTVLTWLVMESTLQSGTFTTIHTATSTSVDTGLVFHESPAMAVQLQAGMFYSIAAHWDLSGTYGWTSPMPYPVTTTFGTHVGGLSGTTIPTGPGAITDSTNGYPVTLLTGSELDGDGDNFIECAECDDTDVAVNPGATEVCDGVDNNCDAILFVGEDDLDNDNDFVCATDCNDTDATIYGGAPELCDGLDNDCDLAVPTNETTDVDLDGSITCADCDDNDILVFPGAAEACDGLDQNCDGTLSASVIVDESPIFEFTGAGGARGRGGKYQVATANVLDTFEVLLDAPVGTTINWQVYEGATENGVYTELFEDSTSSTVVGSDWHTSPSVGVVLQANMYYVVLAQWVPTVTYYWHNTTVAPLPVSFGTYVAPIAYTGAAPPGDSTTFPNGLSLYPVRVWTGEEIDNDLDLFLACAECDDNEVTTFPGAPELCDGLDNDCDTVVPANEVDLDLDGIFGCDDCDDGNVHAFPGATEACDGFDTDCDPTTTLVDDVDDDLDGQAICGGDCNDLEPTIFLGNPELCDGLDNDCDGATPLDEVDVDLDMFLICDGDCDDTEATIFPGATEVCNGIDDDCDAVVPVDELDVDTDGESGCEGDCDDGNSSVNSAAPEACNGVDDNCNGLADADVAGEVDVDLDGFRSCLDCDDAEPLTFPGAPELCNAGIDDDCDPATDEDVDGDTDGSSVCEGDCNDIDAAVFPGAFEVCNGIDDDCDPLTTEDVDIDGDTVTICDGDCDEEDDQVFPDAEEICDGIDNNCDEVLLEGDEDLDGDGQLACGDDCDDTNADTYLGAPELCDGLDNDCDGADIDDEIADEDGDGLSPCDGDCDDREALVFPGAEEVCDGLDNDCDDVLLDDEVDGDGDGALLCDDCDDADSLATPDGLENDEALCADGIDNDCDGTLDGDDSDCPEPEVEGCVCEESSFAAGDGAGAAWVLGLLMVAGMRRRQR